VFFVKLIKILTGILIFWLIFQLLQQLGRKKSTTYKINQDDNNQTRRKYVESHEVEKASPTDGES